MKKTFKIIGLVGVVSLLMSCSADEIQDETPQVKKMKTEYNESQLIENEILIKGEDVNYEDDGNPLNPKDKG
jgi:hypothetical protein